MISRLLEHWRERRARDFLQGYRCGYQAALNDQRREDAKAKRSTA